MSLRALLKSKDVNAIAAYMKEHGLELKGKLIVAKDGARGELKELETFWNQRQQARKILLEMN